MVDSHLPPEVVAAYVDRGLSLSERARVEVHLASCPQCILLVAGVARTVAELSASRPDVGVTAVATPLVSRRSLAGVLAAAAAVFAVVAAPSLVRPWVDRDAGLVNLVERVGEHRSVLGRLTGGFPHAPLGVPPAGGQGGQAAETDRVQLTTGRIRESVGERETPSELHAHGVSQLLAGRYDDAAQSLLAASREQPANAKFLSDVAAVQLERARLGLRSDDLPRALAAADRARRLDPSLREAWFNSALAASALSLNDQARLSFTEYLKRDSSSAWATEARLRLAELSKPTPAAAWASIEGRLRTALDPASADEAVRAHVTEARNLLENVLLVEWANAAGRGGGAEELEPLRQLSDAMLRVAGDALYHDTVAAIDAAGTSPTALSRLADAHRKYAAAAAVYAEDRYVQAEAGLRDAQQALVAANTPYAIRASLDLASVAYIRGRYDESNALTEPALDRARQHRYALSAGRAVWVQGLVAFVQGRVVDAQTKYEDALAEFERSGDGEQVAAAHNLLAALFYYLGDENQAWAHMTPALRGLGITRSLKLRHGILINAAQTVRSIDRNAALAIQDEVVRNALAWGREAAIAESYGQRASILASLGQANAAQTDLAAARRQMAMSPDPSYRARLEVAVLSTETELLRATNPAAAVAAAERAISLIEGRGDRLRLAQLELKLAKANIAWGRTAAAEAALAKGIKAFDEERASLVDEGRASAVDESWGLFETAVQIAIRKNDLPRAFAMSERGRVRSLAEARRATVARTLSGVETALHSDEAIVALNQFDDELAVWIIRASGTRIVTRPLSRRDAQQLVARHRDDIWQQAASADAGRALFNEILRPASAELKGATRLIFIPDSTYEDASFAALWNSVTRRFLIEEATVRVAPSANAFAAAVEHAKSLNTEGDTLVVGADDRAGEMAKSVADIYMAPSLLVGSSATRSNFFSGAADRSVVHLAAPVIDSIRNPLLARVIVADDPGRRHSGALAGSEIAAKTLANTRLIVVDEVEANNSNRGEGTLSQARAFMAAGVPAALGTLPGADENATRDLMIGFHREMARHASAEQALTTVQRNALQENGRRLGAWTALVLYGSDR